jgi:hypothetical protein
VHAALYIGNGQLAEAIHDRLRVNSLAGERFELKTGETKGFLVVRPQNMAMSKEASRIAKELLVEDPQQQTNYKYNIKKSFIFWLSQF